MALPTLASQHGFVEAAVLAVPGSGEETVYRFLSRPTPRPVDFRSDARRDRPVPEDTWWIDYLGISVYGALGRALEIARQYPVHVAELRIPSGTRCYIAETYECGHYTVWASEDLLVGSVSAVYRQESESTEVSRIS